MAEKVVIQSLGCRLNAHEAEIIRQKVDEAGDSDLVIINSCAVTSEAVRQTRQMVRKMRQLYPEGRVLLTGCAVETEGESLAVLPEVDGLVRNASKLDPEAYQQLTRAKGSRRKSGEPAPLVGSALTSSLPGQVPRLDHFAERSRATVQVQGGCDHRCTFCIIPFGRGASQSYKPAEVLEAVRPLVESGYHDITLTGVDITDYGLDLDGQRGLGALVRGILSTFPELARLRLSSLDPAEIDDELLGLLCEEPRLMPHVHLSMQAGHDLILKRMKRRHRTSHIENLCRKLRAARPDFTFGADIIAGFPTESEEHFSGSLALVEACGMTHLHIFPYSSRKGTPAALMPQVEKPVIRERARQLRALGHRLLGEAMTRSVGDTTTVLLETIDKGRTANNFLVRAASPLASGGLRRMRLTAAGADHLVGVPA